MGLKGLIVAIANTLGTKSAWYFTAKLFIQETKALTLS
jgi:hypothetical protein